MSGVTIVGTGHHARLLAAAIHGHGAHANAQRILPEQVALIIQHIDREIVRCGGNQ